MYADPQTIWRSIRTHFARVPLSQTQKGKLRRGERDLGSAPNGFWCLRSNSLIESSIPTAYHKSQNKSADETWISNVQHISRNKQSCRQKHKSRITNPCHEQYMIALVTVLVDGTHVSARRHSDSPKTVAQRTLSDSLPIACQSNAAHSFIAVSKSQCQGGGFILFQAVWWKRNSSPKSFSLNVISNLSVLNQRYGCLSNAQDSRIVSGNRRTLASVINAQVETNHLREP